MREKILEISNKLYHNQLTPEIATELILKLLNNLNSDLLLELMNNQEEIISSPIRFNGVHIEKIKEVFRVKGIKVESIF